MTQHIDLSKDLVSIIIPVYNTGEYLIDCLQSCLNQTHSNIEVIAVDDCSTDPRTIEILKEFEIKDSRIKVIWSSENHGQGYCRNVGVDHCTGKYFAFIDSDDYFKPDFVENMYQGLEKYKTDFAICDSFNYVDDPRLYEIKNFKLLDAETRFNFNAKDQTVVNNFDLASLGFLLKFPVSCYGKMFNTQKYKQTGVRFYDGEFSRHCQDEDWGLNTLLSLKNFVVLKFVGLIRRMHYQSASTPSQKYFYCSVDAVYRRYEMIKDYPFYQMYEFALLKSLLVRFYMLCMFTNSYEERLKVIDLAHKYLIKFDPKFNVDPYNWMFGVGYGWYNLVSALDSKPLPLLYFSLRSLHDANWCESYATKQLLENLSAKGLKVMAFTGLSNTSPVITERYAHIESDAVKYSADEDPEKRIKASSAILQFKDNGVAYFVAKTSPLQKPSRLTELDHRILGEGLEKVFDSHCRNQNSCVTLISGGDLVTQKYCRKLKELGAKLVYLINEPEALHFENQQSLPASNLDAPVLNQPQREFSTNAQYVFAPQEFDAVLSMNPYYAQRFTESYGINAEVLEYAVNPQVVCSKEGPHNFVTFTNPTLEHGLAIVVKLAASFYKLHPEQQFLIIQDQDHNLSQDLSKLHDKSGTSLAKLNLPIRNITIKSDKQLNPIAIAAQTKALLVPASSNNSSIANILECKSNDIPMLTSDLAKYAMFIDEQDHALALPESVIKDPSCLPSDEEIEPWVKSLEKIINSERKVRTVESRQDDYNQRIKTWVDKLYAISGLPEEHDYPDDIRGIK